MTTHALDRSRTGKARALRRFFADVLNGRYDREALIAYMVVPTVHFAEHVMQLAQVKLLGIAPRDAGGLLGEAFPALVANEALHTVYNSLQLTGLILLIPGFRRYRAARRVWTVALIAQSWHWLEHAFLQVQYLTGHYFYGAIKQMSVLERYFPRVELHFAYNLAAFVPTAVALALYLRGRARVRSAR